MQSFRLKISLLTVLLSGIVFVLLGIYVVQSNRQLDMMRIDRETMSFAESQLRGLHPRDHWQRFGQSLSQVYPDGESRLLLLKVIGKDGELLYRDANWNDALDAIPLPHPEGADRPWKPPYPPLPGQEPLPDHQPKPIRLTDPSYNTVKGPSGSWRMLVVGNQAYTLGIAYDLAGQAKQAAAFQQKLIAAGIPLLLALGLAGWFLGTRALRPVNRITKTASSLTAANLSERIPEEAADHEFAALIKVLNSMLERLDSSFKQAVRFSADAAHELKTPLTILQGKLENAIQEAEPGSPAQQETESLLEEVQRLRMIIRRLLLLSQADAGELKLAREEIPLNALAEEALADAEDLYPAISFSSELLPVTVQADPILISQVINNLLSNAARYNLPENGKVQATLETMDGEAVFCVMNTGPHIEGENRERVFQRFYRLDPAHGRQTDGTGLGLSLSREIIQHHGGRLDVETGDPDWNTFVVRLPL